LAFVKAKYLGVGLAGKADAKNTTWIGGDFLAALCMALTAGEV